MQCHVPRRHMNGALAYSNECQLLRAAAELLRFPQPVIATGLTFLHRYYRACPDAIRKQEVMHIAGQVYRLLDDLHVIEGADRRPLTLFIWLAVDRPCVPVSGVKGRRGEFCCDQREFTPDVRFDILVPHQCVMQIVLPSLDRRPQSALTT